MEKEFYSAEEFAKVFDVSYRSVLKAISSGQIRAFKIGDSKRNPYRIPSTEVVRVQVAGMCEINPELENTDESNSA